MTARTHVITGAGTGIGLALALSLVDRGDHVVTVARSTARAVEVLETYEQRLPGASARVRVDVCDLADAAACVALGQEWAGRITHLDSLVHSAGVCDLARVDSFDLDAWQRQLAVNLTAPAVLTRSLLPALRAARGTVLMVNSGAGNVAHPEWSGYAASKHGLRALADALRTEEAGHGVRVTSVYPSRTATQMQEKVHLQEGRPYRASDWMRPESVAASLLHVLDLPVDACVPELSIRTSPSPS